MTGILYIVPTPIGNLADMSERAVQTLQAVDLIAAEDTRHSSTLLQHFSIATKCISLHDHNEKQRAHVLVEKLVAGTNIALISDAGTPLISDPGYSLVSLCRQNDIQVVSLPGCCALIAALSGSGLPSDKFVFYGFLPVKEQAKAAALEQAAQSNITSIFYESPRRIRQTVESCTNSLPSDHQLVIAKEISKHFETYVGNTAEQVLAYLDEDPNHQKGEFVLMLYCSKQEQSELPTAAKSLMQALVCELPPKKAAAVVSEHYKVNKKSLYQYALSLKQ